MTGGAGDLMSYTPLPPLEGDQEFEGLSRGTLASIPLDKEGMGGIISLVKTAVDCTAAAESDKVSQ